MIKTINRNNIAQTGHVPSGMRFLRDSYPLKIKEVKQVLSEEAGGKKVMKITGIFSKAEEQNHNKRIYPMEVIQNAVKLIQEDLPKRCVMGELDHPDSAKIHLRNVSHLITKLWMEGKYVYGEAEVLHNTSPGKDLAALLDHGVSVGISSRGVGDLEVMNEGRHDEYYVVQDGYQFVTWDCVGEPSVQEATMSVMENKMYGGSNIVTRKSLKSNTPEKLLVHEINKFLRK